MGKEAGLKVDRKEAKKTIFIKKLQLFSVLLCACANSRKINGI